MLGETVCPCCQNRYFANVISTLIVYRDGTVKPLRVTIEPIKAEPIINLL